MTDAPDRYDEVFQGSRVLVTGGAGFIGSHLIEALVGLGANVVALDDLSNGAWESLQGFEQTVECVTGSILDQAVLNQVMEGCTYVFHQAALGSVPRSLREPLLYYQVNIMGTVNVLQAATAAGVKRVIFAGSSSAYGDPPVDGPKVETMPAMPLSPYAVSKLAGEFAMQTWSPSFGLDTAVLRYFNIFGPRQNPDSAYAAVIAAFAKAMHGGKSGVIYGDGLQSRDFTFVANVVHANLLAARCESELKGEVMNVACARRITINELHEKMAGLFGLESAAPRYEAKRAGDVLHSLADIDHSRQVLGYEPVVDFEQGLAETVKWYQGHLSQ